MAKFTGKFESNNQEWETPQWLFDKLNFEFHFDCDVAADEKNTKCEKFMDKHLDALTQRWDDTCWLNPPYKQVGKWMKKAHEQMLLGVTVIALVPARTNTNWWHDYCMRAKEIRFIRGRPKFGDAKHGLPQPLAIVIFEPPMPLFHGSDWEKTKISGFDVRGKQP